MIERWWEERVAPRGRRAVAQFHEWMTGAGLLYLKKHAPAIGTVFTTHATMLGRSLAVDGQVARRTGSAAGRRPRAAREHGVVAKHSLEGVCAREADVFTTVSDDHAPTRPSCSSGAAPTPVLPNGIDLDGRRRAGRHDAARRGRARSSRDLAGALPRRGRRATPRSSAISGRYEFHNKGIDLLLDALADARRSARAGASCCSCSCRPGNSGLRGELHGAPAQAARREAHEARSGSSTHNLFDASDDPMQRALRASCGLDNAPGSRVKVVHVPIYLAPSDGLFDLPYEAVLRAMDLTVLPVVLRAVGLHAAGEPRRSACRRSPPTAPASAAGRASDGLGRGDGVTVLARARARSTSDVRAELAGAIETLPRATRRDAKRSSDACRRDRAAHGVVATSSRTTSARSRSRSTPSQKRAEAGVPLVRRAEAAARSGRAAAQGTRAAAHAASTSSATLPEPLARARALARNFWWCWDPEAPALFRELSPPRWDAARPQPGRVPARRLPRGPRRARGGPGLRRAPERGRRALRRVPGASPRGSRAARTATRRSAREHPVAYFCAEFGLHESLPIYSGGLGILAGDHLKSASDLGLPLVGGRPLLPHGLPAPALTAGRRADRAATSRTTRATCRSSSCATRSGDAARGRARSCRARRSCCAPGACASGACRSTCSTPNVPENRARGPRDHAAALRRRPRDAPAPGDRARPRRRAPARSAGHRPGVLPHERGPRGLPRRSSASSRLVREEGLTFDEAREFVRATTVFTTHTPVPAGHDRFGEDLMRALLRRRRRTGSACRGSASSRWASAEDASRSSST